MIEHISNIPIAIAIGKQGPDPKLTEITNSICNNVNGFRMNSVVPAYIQTQDVSSELKVTEADRAKPPSRGAQNLLWLY